MKIPISLSWSWSIRTADDKEEVVLIEDLQVTAEFEGLSPESGQITDIKIWCSQRPGASSTKGQYYDLPAWLKEKAIFAAGRDDELWNRFMEALPIDHAESVAEAKAEYRKDD